jgi:hypothetical protein
MHYRQLLQGGPRGRVPHEDSTLPQSRPASLWQ